MQPRVGGERPAQEAQEINAKGYGIAIVPDTEEPKEWQTNYSMDYMTMDSADGEKALASLVLANHEDGSRSSHGTTVKGIQGYKYQLAKRIANDIHNCWSKDANTQVESDQEPPITALQEEVREIRKGKTICTNSAVGESECNGRAENAARQAQIKARTSRAAIEPNTKQELYMTRLFATRFIRRAGEVITKHSCGKDDKTFWQRRRGEACDKPIAPVGGKVLYLPPKTADIHASKSEPKMFEGTWRGTNGRTEEVAVGTKQGIVKCRTDEPSSRQAVGCKTLPRD